MGYTHYWEFKKINAIKGKQSTIEAKYQLALRQCQRIVRAYNKACKDIDIKHIGRLSGYSAHTRIGDYLGLEVNGTGDAACETFSLAMHFATNETNNFCKTREKPYDLVVTACLIVLKHYLKDLITVSSDGNSTDWNSGLRLAQKVLKIDTLKIPDTIRRNLKSVGA